MTPDAPQRHEVWNLLDAIQMDLRGLAAKWSELRAQVAALELPDPQRVTCPECLLTFSSSTRLTEHLYVQHDGPEPFHWLEAAALAEPDPQDAQRAAFANGASMYDPEIPDDTGRLEHRGKAADANGLTAPVAGDEA